MSTPNPSFTWLVRFFVVALLLSFVYVAPNPAHAADANTIILNDGSPSADINITPNEGAAGVIFVELNGAQLKLTDNANVEALSLSDKRVTALAFEIAAGAPAHTLHLERLPGVTTAAIKVTAQDALPNIVANSASNPTAQLDGPLMFTAKLQTAMTMPVKTAPGADMLTVQFTGQDSLVQLVDSNGSPLLTSKPAFLTGLSLRLDVGDYRLDMVSAKNTPSEVLFALSPAPVNTLNNVAQDNSAQNSSANNASNTTSQVSNTSVDPQNPQPESAAPVAVCNANLTIASANLRSGPGTAYTVLGYALSGNPLPVGGVNKQGGWLLVKSEAGPAWLAQRTAELSGSCDGLPTYDIPLKDGSPRPPTINTANQGNFNDTNAGQPSSGQPSNQSSGGEHHDDNHDDHNDDHGGDD